MLHVDMVDVPIIERARMVRIGDGDGVLFRVIARQDDEVTLRLAANVVGARILANLPLGLIEVGSTEPGVERNAL